MSPYWLDNMGLREDLRDVITQICVRVNEMLQRSTRAVTGEADVDTDVAALRRADHVLCTERLQRESLCTPTPVIKLSSVWTPRD